MAGWFQKAIRTKSTAQRRRDGVLIASKDETIFGAKNTKSPTAAMTLGLSRKIRIVSCHSTPCARWKRAASSVNSTTSLFQLRDVRTRFPTPVASEMAEKAKQEDIDAVILTST